VSAVRVTSRICSVLVLICASQAHAQLELPRNVPLKSVTQKWTGDLDGMIQRRMVRVLVPYSKTFYFVDRGVQRGIVYDLFMQYKAGLNK
jgi:hypothetical protein